MGDPVYGRAGGIGVPGRRRVFPPILAWYVTREFLFSFTVAFLFFFVVFFVNQLLLMAEDILSRRAPFLQVVVLLIYATPSILAISFPFASLVGALMAAGRLSSDNELLAGMVSGVRPGALFTPFVAVGVCIALFSFAMNDILLPLGTIEFGKLYRRTIASTPAVEMGPWSVKNFGDATVVTGAQKDGRIGDLVLFDTSDSGERRITGAKGAELDIGEGAYEALLTLRGVWQHVGGPPADATFQWTSADTMAYRVVLKDRSEISAHIGPREMSSKDLGALIDTRSRNAEARADTRRLEYATAMERLGELQDSAIELETAWSRSWDPMKKQAGVVASLAMEPVPDRTLQVYRLEHAKKFSIPAGALFFVFLAFPLGAATRRMGRTIGFGIGVLVSVVYWALMLAGQTIGTRSGVDPVLAMWMPNIAALLAGSAFWIRRIVSGELSP